MSKKHLIVLSILFVFLISGCVSRNTGSDQHKTSGQITETSETIIFSTNTKETYDYSLLPDFLYGYFDYGVYEIPIRIPNKDYYDEIKVSETNKIVIPELSVLAVCMHKWGESLCLMEQDDTKIIQIFNYLKEVEAKVADDSFLSDIRKESEQDGEITIIVLKADAKYSTITLSSYTNNRIHVCVNQEEQNELQIVVISEMLHKYIREACEVKAGDLQTLLAADKIYYSNKDGKQISLLQQQIDEVKALAGKMTREKNYSSSCPFDLKLIIETKGKKYKAYYSTDSCGVLIIEDKTYKIDKNSRVIMKKIFPDIEWHDQ